MIITNPDSNNIPFLKKYTPYRLQSGIVEVNSINDMVSYEIIPKSVPTLIEYHVGTTRTYVVDLVITNITDNSNIEVSCEYNNTIFDIKSNAISSQTTVQQTSTITTLLKPTDLGSFTVSLQNAILNRLATSALLETAINISVRNLENGLLITKKENINLFEKKQFPDKITVR